MLLTTGYSETPEPVRSYPQLMRRDPGAVPWRTVAMHDRDDAYSDPSYWHVAASNRKWRPGAFDWLIRLVADDVVANVLVVEPDCRWVLHPYDGGMDVFTESPGATRCLRDSFPAWLSPRPDGL